MTTVRHPDMDTLLTRAVALLQVYLQVCQQVATAIPYEFRSLSPYHQKFDLLKGMMEDDGFMVDVFGQYVYFEFDKTYYKDIIEDELLMDARPTSVVTESAVEASETTGDATKSNVDESDDEADGDADKQTRIVPNPVGDAVVPLKFLRNLFTNRFRIYSLVDAALKVVHTAFKCLAYKHVVHMLKLVRTQISRTVVQRKAVSWASKAKESVGILITRMESMQLVDQLLLKSVTFFRVYDKDDSWKTENKFDFLPAMKRISNGMQEFLARHCVKPALSGREKADELGLVVTDSLFDNVESKGVSGQDFKEMFSSSRAMVQAYLDRLPVFVGRISADGWNDLLRYKDQIKSEDEDDDDEMLWNINR